jgi:RNA polymerase subunit RPABC4/transcription elongation factor Spt4
MPTYKHPCPVCRNFIQRDVARCPFCGRVDPFTPGRCEHCGAAIEDPKWVACPRCGASLGEEKVTDM